MAKQTKKTTQKSTAKQTAEKRSKQNKALEKSAKPIRREIGAAICLFLGIFTILSIFGVKSWFTTKLQRLLLLVLLFHPATSCFFPSMPEI